MGNPAGLQTWPSSRRRQRKDRFDGSRNLLANKVELAPDVTVASDWQRCIPEPERPPICRRCRGHRIRQKTRKTVISRRIPTRLMAPKSRSEARSGEIVDCNSQNTEIQANATHSVEGRFVRPESGDGIVRFLSGTGFWGSDVRRRHRGRVRLHRCCDDSGFRRQ